MSGFLYILKDDAGKLYVGSTDNIDRRMYQHRHKHTQTTARMDGPKLMLVQRYDSLKEARKIERKIKNLKRKDYVEKMIKDGYIKME